MKILLVYNKYKFSNHLDRNKYKFIMFLLEKNIFIAYDISQNRNIQNFNKIVNNYCSIIYILSGLYPNYMNILHY
jgi:hypothetical protein